MNISTKYFLYCSLIANALLLIPLSMQFALRTRQLGNTADKKSEVINNRHQKAKAAKKVSIGLLHPASSCLVDTVIQGFKDELAKDSRLECSYTDYDNKGDRMLLRSHVEDVVNKNFDLILSLGHSTSLMTAEITRKRKCTTPIVFSNVQNPVELGLVPENRDETCFITGSSSETIERHEQQFSLLLLLKPDLKRLLIPYYPACDFISKRKIENAEKYMRDHGVSVQKIEIFSIAECLEKIVCFIQEGDAIWIIRDPMIMANIEGISKLASRYQATIYAGNFDAIAKGAGLVFSVDDADSGYNAGRKARAILAEGKHPAHVPITPPSCEHYLWVNKRVLKSQGLKIDPLLSFLIEHGDVVET